MNKYKVAIIGGGGYTAGELLRILLRHPNVHIDQVISQSQAGNNVSSIHQDLAGDTDLVYQQLAKQESDVYFLCMGHGRSGEYLNSNPWLDKKLVIDLSNEFRLSESKSDYVYALPEVFRDQIVCTKKLANPGCFATAIQLGVIPLAHANLLNDHIHIQAITGSTGAGQKPTPTSHFAWRNNNLSIYKAFTHQHLAEIEQTIKHLQPFFDYEIYFVPLRGDFARGIFASMYTKYDGSLEQAIMLYTNYYKDHPFVHISDDSIHLKQVVNTNKCLIQLRTHKGLLHITSIIDNLTKGASGQAVQNMNLALGLPESAGLNLKANYY